MAKQLDDVVFGGIYEYFRTDNDEIVYRGSTEHDTVDDVDNYHRNGHTFTVHLPESKGGRGWKYSWTVVRSNLRRKFGEKIDIRWLEQPREMTREELLVLERERIQEAQALGQCYLNHSDDPLRDWKKFRGK